MTGFKSLTKFNLFEIYGDPVFIRKLNQALFLARNGRENY